MDTKILESITEKIPVEVTAEFNPQEFFRDREGLFVYSSFKEHILEKASIVSAGTKFELSSFKLIRSAEDEEIEKELPEKHIFSESDVCAIIAELISKQPKGEEGELLNTGYWNLFYTESFVVDVSWRDGEWYVSAWDRDSYGWSDGSRVFSPAN